eukprot:Skav205706  [mRNA]  locus=scaffold608:9577:14587:+ [translate_table: standard]
MAMLACCLQKLRLEVSAQHGWQLFMALSRTTEIQGEVAEALNDGSSLATLNASELTLHFTIEVALGCQDSLLPSAVLKGLVCSKQLVMKLIHILQEELVRILLTIPLEHGRCNGNLFPQFGRTQRQREGDGLLHLLQDLHCALEQSTVDHIRELPRHVTQVLHKLPQGANGLGHCIEVTGIARFCKPKGKAGR